MANLSNINNILRTGSLGVGINKDPASPFEVSSATKPGIKMFNTATNGKTYQAYSDENGNYIIYDEDADDNRFVINSSGDATFAQKIIAGGRISTEATTSNALLQVKYNSSNYLEAYYDKLNVVGGNFQFQTAGTTKMVLTTTGNVGIGTTSPGSKLEVKTSGANTTVELDNSDTNYTLIQYNAQGATKGFSGFNAGFMLFGGESGTTTRLQSGGSYAATILENGNFGIGTTNPGNLLDVAGDTDITGQLFVTHDANYVAKIKQTATSMSNGSYTFEIDSTSHTSNMSTAGAMSVDVNSGRAFTINGIGRVSIGGNVQSANTLTLTGSATELDIENTSGKRYRFNCDTSGNLKFEDKTGGTEVMRFASSNNVGIGTTSPSYKLTVADSTVNGRAIQAIQSATSGTNWGFQGGAFGSGATKNIGLQVTAEGASTNYAALFTGGNVGIGTTTPNDFDGESRNLVIRGGVDGSTPTIGMTISTDGNQASTGRCAIRFADGISGTERYRGALEYNHNGDDMSFRTAGTQKMTLTDGGDLLITTGIVGIGTTSPRGKGLEIFRAAGLSSNPQLILSTGENSSLDYSLATDTVSAGDFCILSGVVNTSSAIKMRFQGNDVFFGTPTSTYPSTNNFVHINTQSGVSMVIGGHSGTHTSVQFRHNGATIVGSIVVTSTSTTYNTSSDYRLKEDLQDFSGLDMVSKIPVYDFKWKTETKRSYGVIAHELQEVLSDAVSGEKDEEEMQGVDYSKIVPILVKSIQELKADNDSLRARIETLENN